MARLAFDLKFAIRGLLRAPGFAAAAILMLAVGMGAASTVYGYLSALLTAAAPPVDLDRRVALWSHNRAQADPKGLVSLHDYVAWRERARSFETLAAMAERSMNLGAVAEPVRVQARAVTPGYFDSIGVRVAQGRAFRDEDTRPGAEPVAILSHRDWRERLQADPRAIGRTVLLDGVRTTIVGVLSEGELQPPVLVPLTLDLSRADRSARTLFVFATMRPGVTREQAAGEMASIARQLEAEYPDSHRGWTVNTTPLVEEFIGSQARLAMGIQAAVVIAVLLIACANVANLTLARGLSREREFAVRSALGAGTGRIVQQLLVEGLLLSVAAAAIGLLVARWALISLRAMFASSLPIAERFTVDADVYLFALGLSLISTVLFGLWPALQIARGNAASGLRQASTRTTSGRGARVFRAGLVAGEAALTVLFLVVALLLMRTMINLQGIADRGFDPARVLTARVTLPESTYPAPGQFFERVTAALASRAGVAAASAGTRVPAQGSRYNPNRSLQIQGRPVSSDEPVWAQDMTVMPGYFATLAIPVLAGRDFTPRDAAGAPLVALVNRTMADQYWPGRSAVGARLKIGSEDWRTIVGVVGDVRNDDIDAPPTPQLYVPLAQRPERTMTLVVRAQGDPSALAATLRAIVREIDRELPLYEVRTMREVLDADLRDSWLLIQIIGLFALCALLLATAGIYAVVSHAVSQRTHEIGIRMALGASVRDVVSMTVRQGLTPVGLGIGAGVIAAAGASQLLRSILYQVAPLDPVAFGGTVALLLALAALAALVPARRSARIDPLQALRQE